MLREKVQLGLFSFVIFTRPFIEDNREYLYKRSEIIMKKFMHYVNEVSVCISLILMIIVLIGYVFGITIICGSLLVLIRTCVLTVIKLIMYYATKIYRLNVNTKMITIINGGLI